MSFELFKVNAIMLEQITTISEIDTVITGTLLAKENPHENIDAEIYKVVGKTEFGISINPKASSDPDENLTMNPDDLFDKGWWMLKTEED
jgi:hypothetical protein